MPGLTGAIRVPAGINTPARETVDRKLWPVLAMNSGCMRLQNPHATAKSRVRNPGIPGFYEELPVFGYDHGYSDDHALIFHGKKKYRCI